MDMCYDGALVMPSSYARMKEEMCYVEGGTSTIKGTAKRLKTQAGALMASWFSLAIGYTYAAALAAATGAGRSRILTSCPSRRETRRRCQSNSR